MHTFIHQNDGWTVETLADDSDTANSLTAESALEAELRGCCSIKEIKANGQYTGEIRYEEQKHNRLVLVEAVVFKHSLAENREKDVRYFRRSRFEGDHCKKEAAYYAFNLKKEIDSRYFSGKRL